jgi:putative ABC transport system permease protein
MGLLSDLRYSVRSLARSPGFTLTLVLSIAVGIGSNAVVFGFVTGLVSRNLPIAGIDRLVSIFGRDPQDGYGPISFADLRQLTATSSAFESLGAIRSSIASVVVDGRSSLRPVAAMTPGFFDVLDPSLSLPANGVVISHRLWRDELQSRMPIVGETLAIEGTREAVAGVAPEWLDGLYLGRDVDVWTPSLEAPPPTEERSGGNAERATGGRTLWAIARLRAGASIRSAEIEANQATTPDNAVALLGYSGVPPDLAGSLSRIRVLLPAAAITVFLVSCATVAGFLLSRSSARSHETSVRVALGASRAQLGRLLLADSLAIAAGGGALAILLATWTTHLVPALVFDQDAEALVFAPNLGAILGAAAIAAIILVVCGLAPFAEVRDDDPAAVLRRESGGLSNAARRVRAGLVIGQMACGCLLLIATGLLIEGFRNALRTTAATRAGHPIVALVQARAGYASERDGARYFQDAEAAALKVPGISSVAWVGALPGSRPAWQALRVERPTTIRRTVVMDVAVFQGKAVATLADPVKAGRMFGGRDTPRSCRSVMIDEAAAADLFDNDAVGRSIDDPTGQPVEIIGVLRLKAPGGRPTVYYYPEQSAPPFDETGSQRFQVPVRPASLPKTVLDANVMSRGYVDTLRLAPTAGALFPSGLDPLDCRVGLVNQEAAALAFGGDAVGGAVIDAAGHRTRIVGVIPSVMLRASQRRAEPAIAYPMEQNYQPRLTMILETPGADARLAANVRRQIAAVQGGAPLAVATLDDYLSRTALAPERLGAMLVGTSAAMAMGLCLAGVYGAMTDSVRRRRREIAVRLALGAQGRRVVGQVLRDGLKLASAGAAAGMAASLVIARWIAQVAHTASRPSLWIWLSVPSLLAVVLAVAGVLPARKALSVDPLEIMRDS